MNEFQLAVTSSQIKIASDNVRITYYQQQFLISQAIFRLHWKELVQRLLCPVSEIGD